MKESWDIGIVGGGPAGCAAAITLRRWAPHLRVVIATDEGRQQHRIGESLPSRARSVLEELGVWTGFQQDGHVPASGVSVSWNSPAWDENDFIYSMSGHGWHLDRARFDSRLRQTAGEQGATVLPSCRIVKAISEGSAGVQLISSTGSVTRVQFVIDASGRAALTSRSLGARAIRHDALVGIFRIFSGSDTGQARLLVEATPFGWWYCAGLPQNRHLVALMTDADIAAAHRLSTPARWDELLSQTARIRAYVAGSTACTSPRFAAAHSQILDCSATESRLAAGDAVSCVDPLSSMGILKGLRSGMLGAYAAIDWLVKRDPLGLAKYRAIMEAEFKAFLHHWALHYSREQRWPEADFWRRRRSPDFPFNASIEGPK